MAAIFPLPGQEIWQLGEQLAALGGVRGQDYHLQRARRGVPHHYRLSDDLLDKWWAQHGEDTPATAPEEGTGDKTPGEPAPEAEPATQDPAAVDAAPGDELNQNAAPADEEKSTEDSSDNPPAENDRTSTQRPPARKNARKG